MNKHGPYPKKKACKIHPDIVRVRCHVWTAGCFKNGYGIFWDGTYLANGRPRYVRTHRFSYELAHGVGSLGSRECCHKCDNKKCVNALHLFKGTHRANMHDKVAKGRSLKGEQYSAAKLVSLQVRVIRSLHALGNCSYEKLSKEFGVHATMIGFIVRRKKWAHVR